MVTKVRSIVAKVRETSLDMARRVAVASVTPTEKQAQLILLVAGITALGLGLSHESFAQGSSLGALNGQTSIDDARIANAVQTVMTFLEGSFGALIMAASGILAICSAAFGQYKAAMSCMVVAVGAFILRSMMNTFFNIQSLSQQGGIN